MSAIDQELHNAVRENDITKVEQLLLKGAKIDEVYYGWTPLQQSIDKGHDDVSTFLIDKGCDINYHDNRHISPFEDAVNKGQAKVVECLLKKGINGNATLSSGEKPITVAVEKECLPLVSVLVNTGKVKLNIMNNKGESPMYVAAQEGYHEICEVLASAGADVNFVCKDDSKFTPLITAIANECIKVVKILLKYNCDLESRDSDEWTALWHAYTNSNEELVEILLKAGADKSFPNFDGMTMLQDAIENDEYHMIELLRKY